MYPCPPVTSNLTILPHRIYPSPPVTSSMPSTTFQPHRFFLHPSLASNLASPAIHALIRSGRIAPRCSSIDCRFLFTNM
ncbi:hypothetical protein E2C01_041200 [Portunus trituberculatus]|uniref:Uncharacterized protein n=1 Tax=Portunus trituberculatus TaxID=210409 RepID=A0A5B7FR21_PORTR|nr:hypothetical protein [Portunus trituberculatus]